MRKILLLMLIAHFYQSSFAQKTMPKPNVSFSTDYIQKNKGKTTVEIPEVSELVNIIMALHKDGEKESNMFDTKTSYYEKVKKHFGHTKDLLWWILSKNI